MPISEGPASDPNKRRPSAACLKAKLRMAFGVAKLSEGKLRADLRNVAEDLRKTCGLRKKAEI
jgi:hypothetical protein